MIRLFFAPVFADLAKVNHYANRFIIRKFVERTAFLMAPILVLDTTPRVGVVS